MAKRKNTSYISGKESRQITRFNRKLTKRLEKERASKASDPSKYMTEMRDANNIVEFDNVCSYFFFKFRKIIFFLISAASSQFLHKINTRKLELRVKQRLLFFRKRREIRFFYNLF